MSANAPQSALVRFAKQFVATTVAVLVAAHVVPGISYSTYGALVATSLLLGLLNAVVRPLLVILSIALVVLTFGLGYLVINGLLFWLAGSIVRGFHVDGFWPAFFGGLTVSIVSTILNALLGTNRGLPESRRGRRRDADPPNPPSGSGPIIDV